MLPQLDQLLRIIPNRLPSIHFIIDSEPELDQKWVHVHLFGVLILQEIVGPALDFLLFDVLLELYPHLLLPQQKPVQLFLLFLPLLCKHFLS